MKQSQIINLMVLLFALLYSAQAVTAESAKTSTKTISQSIKGAVKPVDTKKALMPTLHKKVSSEEKGSSKQGKKELVQPKVIPQPVKKGAQPPGDAIKMSKPLNVRDAAKPPVGAKVKVAPGLLKQVVQPNRKPKLNVIKPPPGMAGNSQGGMSKKIVIPTGISETTRPVNNHGGFQGFASGRSRGSDGRPSNQSAADAIRNAAASGATQARITSVAPQVSGYSCVPNSSNSSAQFVINGSRFGSAANGRTVKIATRVRNTTVAEAEVISWSDSQIVAVLPYGAPGPQFPQRYAVGLKNSAGHWVSNTNRELATCPADIVVTGRITLDHCAANLENVKIGLTVDGRPRRDIPVTAVTGDSFAMQYRFWTPFKPQLDLQLTPKLVGIDCPGGAWSPLNNTMRLGDNRSRATQNFDYSVELETFQIPMRQLASMVRTAFTGTTIRLNNYDPTTRGEREWDSIIRLSDALGGTERRLGLPPVVSGPRTYYINDINLDSIRVVPAGNELRIRLSFEDAGMEFIGQCKDDAECIAGAPDVQARIRVDVYVALERYVRRGASPSISYGSVRVVATPNAQADGVCLALDGLCNLISDYSNRIKEAIEVGLYNELNTTQVRDQVANALSPTLSGLRIGRINSAGVEGSNFVIRYIPAE